MGSGNGIVEVEYFGFGYGSVFAEGILRSRSSLIKRTKNRGISQFSAALFGPSQIYFTLHIPKQLYLLKSLILFLLLIKEFGGVSLGQSF